MPGESSDTEEHGNRIQDWCVKVGMNDFRIPPPGLFDRIYDLLAWDRDTWDVDPPDGWAAPEQRCRAD